MNGKCFEIGTIQAFLDGETTPDVSLRLSDHIASCDACARTLAAADEESSLVFSALERELNTLVPTQRLWTRINDTIAVEKSNVPFWEKIYSYVTSSLLNPSIAAAAGILLVLGMLGVVIQINDNAYTLVSEKQAEPVPASPDRITPVTDPPETKATDVAGSTVSEKPLVGTSKLGPQEIKALAASVNANSREIRPRTADLRIPSSSATANGYLPGEESYVKTISDLKQNVDEQKDSVMTPSTRVSYERDMAVVNDSITRMRDVVKKNPRNQAARQVLYSSYQDTIDLLNSVAQREELLVSLR